MPIYEFYCEKCNTIFNFYSKTINTQKIPTCPNCPDHILRRQLSMFAISSNKSDSEEHPDFPVDDAKMEQAMNMLSGETPHLDENDPKQAVQLMRKLSDITGIGLGAHMNEALHRIESGEDPESIEAEMGDILESEDPFVLQGHKGKKTSSSKIKKVDETLYDL